MGSLIKEVVLSFGLKVASTTVCGLFAGCSLYINACEVPANLEHGMLQARENWQSNFNHASKFQVNII